MWEVSEQCMMGLRATCIERFGGDNVKGCILAGFGLDRGEVDGGGW